MYLAARGDRIASPEGTFALRWLAGRLVADFGDGRIVEIRIEVRR